MVCWLCFGIADLMRCSVCDKYCVLIIDLAPAAGGSLTRAKDEGRIEFLAQARNRALEPLWLNGSLPTSTSLLLPHDPEARPLLRVFCRGR